MLREAQLRFESQGGRDPIFDGCLWPATRRDVYDHVRLAAHPIDCQRIYVRIRCRTAVLRIAGVEMDNRGTRLRRTDRLLGDLFPSDR
ncbi:hypothetical protein X744_32405 [Mesorhizobium sp. LNJC372A00]|nr:hypothetical protein X745_31210 [Mesorhizobium sp. LNJC374B00]ESY48191.1 hypothetical protein X744_32405 [Mesorhizobium sp. LNJC372A00]